jgi:hypothetical protein
MRLALIILAAGVLLSGCLVVTGCNTTDNDVIDQAIAARIYNKR